MIVVGKPIKEDQVQTMFKLLKKFSWSNLIKRKKELKQNVYVTWNLVLKEPCNVGVQQIMLPASANIFKLLSQKQAQKWPVNLKGYVQYIVAILFFTPKREHF